MHFQASDFITVVLSSLARTGRYTQIQLDPANSRCTFYNVRKSQNVNYSRKSIPVYVHHISKTFHL